MQCYFQKNWTSGQRKISECPELIQHRILNSFYESVVYNTAQFLAMCAVHYYRFEQIWSEINPMPLYSATMKSCIEKKTEITKGGAVYNSTSFSLIGIGTFIDSLYAIKKTVFEDRKYTLEHLKEMIKADFQGFEADRQYLTE